MYKAQRDLLDLAAANGWTPNHEGQEFGYGSNAHAVSTTLVLGEFTVTVTASRFDGGRQVQHETRLAHTSLRDDLINRMTTGQSARYLVSVGHDQVLALLAEFARQVDPDAPVRMRSTADRAVHTAEVYESFYRTVDMHGIRSIGKSA